MNPKRQALSEKPTSTKNKLQDARYNSTRRFKREALNQKVIERLFDAATKVPSYNNVPAWKFYASSTDHFDLFLSFINMESLNWVNSASLIVIITANKTSDEGNCRNKHWIFECGAAWFAITRQAYRMNLHTHVINDIKEKRIIEQLSIPQSEQIICAAAVGIIDQNAKNSTTPFTPTPLKNILTIF